MKTPVLNEELRVSMQSIAKKLFQLNGSDLPDKVDLVLFGSTALQSMGIKDSFNDIDVFSSVSLPGTADQESLSHLFSVENELTENGLKSYEVDVTDCPYLLQIHQDKISYGNVKDQPIAEIFEFEGHTFNFKAFSPERVFLQKLVDSRSKDIVDMIMIAESMIKNIVEEKGISVSKATIEAINLIIAETRMISRENQNAYEATQNLWSQLSSSFYEAFDLGNMDAEDLPLITDMLVSIMESDGWDTMGMSSDEYPGEESFPIYEEPSFRHENSDECDWFVNDSLWNPKYD